MQHLYSQVIIAFLGKAKALAKQILEQEMGIKVGRERFIYQNYRYPLHIVVFEGKSTLGYFNPNFFEIGLNKRMINNQDDLLDTLRHELAHYILYLREGDLTHSANFRQLCRDCNWGKSVYAAKKLENEPDADSKMSQKIKKLLALSKSSHPAEAQNALLKAHELMAKHPVNIEADLIVKRVLDAKRTPPKWHPISDILRTFGVYPVFNKGQTLAYLEIFGQNIHVQAAEYIAHFLNQEFERLWEHQTDLQGLTARHSFFDGIALGYLEKLKSKKQSPGLIVLQNQLTENLWMPYPHLTAKASLRKQCQASLQAGKRAGKNLKVRQPIEKQKAALFLPTY